MCVWFRLFCLAINGGSGMNGKPLGRKLFSHHQDVTCSVSYTILIKVYEVLEDTNKEFSLIFES
ncbi:MULTISPECIES: hypothetical protein [Enterococcus]|uniref:hypothetical protein n=1 Tax=Enterococcus TaxID=1350 RepID=UPI00189A40B5|nr:hypothetical protein [Enterococcus mundtii]MDV7745547.1 hypothetical protein [Enterococcus mundtii]